MRNETGHRRRMRRVDTDLDGLPSCGRLAEATIRPGWIRVDPAPPMIRGVELTQGVQYFPPAPGSVRGRRRANSIPLIADKDLFVRVFVSGRGTDWPGGQLPANLGMSVSATVMGGARHDCLVFAADLNELWVGDRTKSAGSFNAWIPSHACRGTVTIDVRLTRLTAGGGSEEIARQVLRAAFAELPSVPVLVVPVELDVTGGPKGDLTVGGPTRPECEDLLRELVSRFPFPSFLPQRFADGITYPTAYAMNLADVKDQLSKHDLATTVDLVITGVIGAGWLVDVDPNVVGLGGGGVVVSPAADPDTAAHELGHVLGRLHAPCRQGSPDPGFPDYWPSPRGSIGEVGFRAATGTPGIEALGPDVSYDFMGGAGCAPAWTSAYGWEQAIRSVRRCAWRRRPPPAPRMLLHLEVTGPDSAALGPSYLLCVRPPAPSGPPSAYRVDLLRADGRLLGRHRLHELDLVHATSGQQFPRRFLEAVSWDPAVDSLAVHRDGVLVDHVALGDEEPVLEAVNVDPIGVGAAVVAVAWAPAPPGDDDPTRYLVRYSNDDGASWTALAADLKAAGIQLRLDGLPSGERCRIEVAATRLGRTAVRQSAPFPRDPAPLRTEIVRPRPPAGGPVALALTDVVDLVGVAFSPDRPPVPSEALRWSYTQAPDPEQVLGVGERLLIPSTRLPPGLSAIHLRVDGADASFVTVDRAAI